MKRDDDFLRQLLFEIEELADTHIAIENGFGITVEQEKKCYHAQLLCDAGLLLETSDSVYRLTNSGHDYIAAVRDENNWRKTKEAAAQVGGVTLGIFKEIAVAYLKQELKSKIGLEI